METLLVAPILCPTELQQTQTEKEINSTSVATKIAELLIPHRRVLQSSEPGEDIGLNHLTSCVSDFVSNNRPIHMIMPSFPCKSSSHLKVFGRLPDMAEEISLKFLDSLCKEIEQVHKPGVRLTICSDGRVFSPHIRVCDESVSEFRDELTRLITGIGAKSIDLFSLEDHFAGTPDEMREQLLRDHGKTFEQLREETHDDLSLMNTRLGLTRFMLEEGKAWDQRNGVNRSGNQQQKDAKQRAWHVLQGSQAWGGLLDTVFPQAVRLSIHPQSKESSKFGLFLMPTSDCFMTPWHGVAVRQADRWRLEHREDAERLPGRVVFRKGRPSHFEQTTDI